MLALHQARIDGGVGIADLLEIAQRGLHLACLGRRQVERGAHRRLELDLQLGHIGLGHEFSADVFQYRETAEERHQREHHHRLAVREAPSQQSFVRQRHPLHEAVKPRQHPSQRTFAEMPLGLRVLPDRGQHRIEGETHEHRDEDRRSHRQPELVEEAADDPAHEPHGQEHRHDGERRRQHREADLARPLERRSAMVPSHGHMPHDVLAHDNCIVDEQPHRQGQCHQRQHVQRESERIDEEE